MKLTKITARNFKGLSFELNLRDINFIVGINFGGKSARTDAIRLLLLGFLPELGKQNRATFGLSSGREMSVEGTFDNGTVLCRTWHLEGDTVKATVNTKDLSILENESLAVMLNAETYFALSDRERVNYVFANVPMGGKLTPDDIVNRVESGLIRLGNKPEVIADVVIRLQGHKQPDVSPQEAVEFLLKTAVEMAKSAKEYAVKMEKTAQGLSALRANDTEKTVNFSELDARRTTLTQEIQSLHEEKAKHSAAGNHAKATKKRREQLLSELRAKPASDRRMKLTGELTHLKNDLANLAVIVREEVEELRTRLTDARAGLRDYEKDIRDVNASISKNERELAEVDSKEKCPYCGAEGTGWKSLKEAEIKSALSGLRVKSDQLAEHVGKIAETIAALVQEINAKHEALTARETLEKTVIERRTVLDAFDQTLVLFQQKETELAGLPVQSEEQEAALNHAQTSLDAKQQELISLDNIRRAAMGRENDIKRLAQAETDRDKAKAEETVAKVAADILREIQAKMVEDAFTPLLATANSLFGAILREPLDYQGGEIGMQRDGVFVTHATFSGTEKLLAYAAIQAALSSKSPVRLMILDELGRLDEDNIAFLVGAIEQSVASGKIEQFIGISARKIEMNPMLNPEISSQVVEIG